MGNKKEEGKTRHTMQVLQWEGGGRWWGGGVAMQALQCMGRGWEVGEEGRRAVTPQ